MRSRILISNARGSVIVAALTIHRELVFDISDDRLLVTITRETVFAGLDKAARVRCVRPDVDVDADSIIRFISVCHVKYIRIFHGPI